MVLALARGMDPLRFRVVVASLGGTEVFEGSDTGRMPAPQRTADAAGPMPATQEGLLTRAAREAGIEAELWPKGQLRHIPQRIVGRFDIIHTYGSRADLLARTLKAFHPGFRDIKLVSGVRGAEDKRAVAKVWLDRLGHPLIGLFIANSEAGRQSRILRERIPAQKIITIHNGIDLDSSEADLSREDADVAEDTFPLIAHVANLRPMKGHDVALGALKILLEDFPQAFILFAGRDDCSGRVQRMAREMGLGPHVRFLGYHERTRALVRLCDMAILPSRHEGLPVSILEAMAESRPVVASRVGGIPEMMTDGEEGLLVEAGDPQALAQAVRQLAADDTLRARMGRQGWTRVQTQFTLESMVRKYEGAYAALMDN